MGYFFPTFFIVKFRVHVEDIPNSLFCLHFYTVINREKIIIRILNQAGIKVFPPPQFIIVLEIKFRAAKSAEKTFAYGTWQYARVNLGAQLRCAAFLGRRPCRIRDSNIFRVERFG
jgi:hypothetical protein